jgi:hypothetical protein
MLSQNIRLKCLCPSAKKSYSGCKHKKKKNREGWQNMAKKTKENAQFAVSMHKADDGRWVGNVIWINAEKTQSFRSTLELIKLLDSAVEKTEKMSGEENKE